MSQTKKEDLYRKWQAEGKLQENLDMISMLVLAHATETQICDYLDIYEVLHTCAICGKDYAGPGNNAEPLASGRCCDDCNRKVIAERIRRSKQ